MAIRAPDPHNLRNAALKVGVIAGDRECPGCGYNLRGLPLQSKCPECGMTVIAPHSGEIDDPLSLAPTRIILVFIRGCWAASIIVGLVIALNVAQRFPDWDEQYSLWGFFGLSVLWVGAVIWLTPAFGIPQAAMRGFSRRGKLRALARWLQWGWVLAAGLRVLQQEATLKPPMVMLVGAALSAGLLAGMIGVICLSILLEHLSEWARDDRAENLFNWATWTIPVTTLLLCVNLPLPFIGQVFILLWVFGMLMFPYALLSLSGSVTLSVVHAHEHRQREQRRTRRTQRYQDQVAQAVRTMDAERQRRGHV